MCTKGPVPLKPPQSKSAASVQVRNKQASSTCVGKDELDSLVLLVAPDFSACMLSIQHPSGICYVQLLLQVLDSGSCAGYLEHHWLPRDRREPHQSGMKSWQLDMHALIPLKSRCWTMIPSNDGADMGISI